MPPVKKADPKKAQTKPEVNPDTEYQFNVAEDGSVTCTARLNGMVVSAERNVAAHAKDACDMALVSLS